MLEGSVRKAGNRLRISAQLIDVAGGHHLWSEVFDRSLEDVFQIQDEIARTIATTVAPKLQGTSLAPLVVRPTESQEAYELYLRAGERISGIDRWDTRTAITLLEKATAIDPTFAGAWARLAFGCCQMGFRFDDSQHWHDQAREAVRRAFELDAGNAEAKLAHARILWSPRGGFENRPALRALREILQLKPGSHEALRWQSLIFLHVGLMNEAREGFAEGLVAQPNDPTTLMFISQTAFAEGCYEEAADYLSRAEQN